MENEIKDTPRYRLRSNDEKDAEFERESYVRRQQTIQMKSLKAQLEWVKRQIEYLQFAEGHESQFELFRGEVYEFDWGVNVHSEFSNRHYGVVLADSGKNNPLVLVCPLKTNRYGANPKSDVNLGIIPSIVTECETLAVINQIRSLDKLRLYVRPIIHDTYPENGKVRLTEAQFAMVQEGIAKYLQLYEILIK